ncbi:hypothetical protein LguiB_025974 [Lonicera macranthoides]
MAATAAAAIGSSFSTSIQSLKCTKSLYTDPHLRATSTRVQLQVASINSHFLGIIEPISIGSSSRKWWAPRISAAVAQEEAALTAPVAPEEEGVAEEKAEEEVPSGGEGEDDAHSTGGVNTKLYFGNLPYHCDSAQLAGIIQEYGSPELVEVLYDRTTGKSRGFAFVTMSTVEDCNAVIENLDKSEYGGRTLRVNLADKPRAKEPLYPETEYKLFIGNLAWSVTSETLTEVFGEYGKVVGARVLYDGETGRSRGYGFVCYPTKEEMETALQSLNGMVISLIYIYIYASILGYRLHWASGQLHKVLGSLSSFEGQLFKYSTLTPSLFICLNLKSEI